MGCVGVILDLILNRSFSLSSFISGCTLQRICPVCVEHKDDFIIILCHLHQSVIEAATQITDCHYSRCFCFVFCLASAQEPCHPPAPVLSSDLADQKCDLQNLYPLHLGGLNFQLEVAGLHGACLLKQMDLSRTYQDMAKLFHQEQTIPLVSA